MLRRAVRHQVPDYGEPRDWLLILCYYAKEIPMYQITRILQLQFGQPFDPLKTREYYETLDRDGAQPFCPLCGFIERGVNDRYVASVLETARERRKDVLRQEDQIFDKDRVGSVAISCRDRRLQTMEDWIPLL
ncbi:MAG: hypothetical protein Q9216_003278 [Gyalolechia sp. 2 TL-2023]